MTSLYEQICKTQRVINFEPKVIKIGKETYDREEAEDHRVYYKLRRKQTKEKH